MFNFSFCFHLVPGNQHVVEEGRGVFSGNNESSAKPTCITQFDGDNAFGIGDSGENAIAMEPLPFEDFVDFDAPASFHFDSSGTGCYLPPTSRWAMDPYEGQDVLMGDSVSRHSAEGPSSIVPCGQQRPASDSKWRSGFIPSINSSGQCSDAVLHVDQARKLSQDVSG